jgi:2-C-methyl-D-erythritol 4-phosphate cytidylyltransferase
LKKSAIIVAGGTGTRMNSDVPKQFLPLCRKPLLVYSLEAFSEAFPEIDLVIALPRSLFPAWETLCEAQKVMIPHRLAEGGETRFHSVKNALTDIGNEGLVAIHDAARPLVTPALIREAFLAAETYGNCIPVVPLRESVRAVTGELNCAADRELLRIVQTPQVFRVADIKEAYRQEYREYFTDDATVAEGMGETIHLIDGDPANFKITHPYDLAAAEALLKTRESN